MTAMHKPASSFAKKLAAVSAAFVLAFGLLACSQTPTASEPAAPEADEQPATVRVASLKGPTTIGLVDFMAKAESGSFENTYEFSIGGAADEILPQLIKGDIDIALIPANAAATVYAKSQGAVAVINVNTLGVLSIVTGDESVNSIADLAGRTVLMTGKGATPEYVMNYLLDKAGIADRVTLEFKSEATEVAAALAADPMAVAVLPQPYATAAGVKNPAVSSRVSLTEQWDALQGSDGSRMVTGVTVVRKAFLEEHPGAVAEFLAGQRASVETVNADPAAASQLVAQYGIIEKAPIAAKAIPNCSLVCLTGPDMKEALSGYLSVLHAQNPASVGGSLPDDSFYWVGE